MQVLNWQFILSEKFYFIWKHLLKKIKIAKFHRTRALFRKLRCVRNQINWLINEMKYRETLSSALKLNNSYMLLVGKCIWQHVRSLLFGTRLLVNTIAFFNFLVCPGEPSYEKRIKIALHFQEIQFIIRVIQCSTFRNRIYRKHHYAYMRFHQILRS